MTNPDALFDFAVDKIEFVCTDVNLGSCNPLLDDSNSNTLVDEIWNESSCLVKPGFSLSKQKSSPA